MVVGDTVLDHTDPFLEFLRVADLPITALLVLFLFALWREYRELRQQFTEYLMERAAGGDEAAAVVTDRMFRKENGQVQ